MSEQGVDKEPIFDEGLAIIHDELMKEIKNHFSAGEPTKQTSLNIALQYLNSGMMKAVIYERKNKLKLEKEKAAMLAVLKTWYACNCNRTSSCLVEICGFKAKQIVEEIEKLGGGG